MSNFDFLQIGHGQQSDARMMVEMNVTDSQLTNSRAPRFKKLHEGSWQGSQCVSCWETGFLRQARLSEREWYQPQ